ncbi:hypothetical protein STENM223S_02427 [Streptomyces tendae]
MPRVRLSPCRSPVTRSGRAISQLVTVASSAGRQRWTAAVPKKLPETRTAPQATKPSIQSIVMPPTMITRRLPVVLIVVTSTTVPATQPTNSSSSSRAFISGTRSWRTVPVRRQTKSIAPTTSGVMNSRTTEAVSAFSISWAASKPPSKRV